MKKVFKSLFKQKESSKQDLTDTTSANDIHKSSPQEQNQSIPPPTQPVIEQAKDVRTNSPLPTRTQFNQNLHDPIDLNNHPFPIFQKSNYKFIATLGEGSYGLVKSAIHIPTNQMVAIKLIKKSRMRKREDRLRNEIDILIKCQQKEKERKGLLNLMDWGVGTETIYIVTELAQGGELFERIIERGKFFEKDAATCAWCLLDAIQFLHSLDIVHRDLKPENIFMRDPRHKDYSDLVVGDFGISKFVTSKRPQLKTKIGSNGYMAPEILLEKGYGKEVDIWSIGVIVYILLSGMTPFKQGDFDYELEQILSIGVRFDHSIWRSISEEAKTFITSCLQIDPTKRPTATEAIQHPWILKFAKQTKKQVVQPKSDDKTLTRPIETTSFSSLHSENSAENLFPMLQNAIREELEWRGDANEFGRERNESVSSQVSLASSGFGPRSSDQLSVHSQQQEE